MDYLESVVFFFNPPKLDLYFILVQVGNQAFANYVDAMANLNVIHINNKSASNFFKPWSNEI